MGKLFGFCPSGYNQIVVFTDEAEFVKIVAANPGMTENPLRKPLALAMG